MTGDVTAALAQLLKLSPWVFPAVAVDKEWAAALKQATAAITNQDKQDETGSAARPAAQPHAAGAAGIRPRIDPCLLPDHRPLARVKARTDHA